MQEWSTEHLLGLDEPNMAANLFASLEHKGSKTLHRHKVHKKVHHVAKKAKKKHTLKHKKKHHLTKVHDDGNMAEESLLGSLHPSLHRAHKHRAHKAHKVHRKRKSHKKVLHHRKAKKAHKKHVHMVSAHIEDPAMELHATIGGKSHKTHKHKKVHKKHEKKHEDDTEDDSEEKVPREEILGGQKLTASADDVVPESDDQEEFNDDEEIHDDLFESALGMGHDEDSQQESKAKKSHSLAGFASSMLEENDAAEKEALAEKKKQEAEHEKEVAEQKKREKKLEKMAGGKLVHLDLSNDQEEDDDDDDLNEDKIAPLDSFMDDIGEDDY